MIGGVTVAGGAGAVGVAVSVAAGVSVAGDSVPVGVGVGVSEGVGVSDGVAVPEGVGVPGVGVGVTMETSLMSNTSVTMPFSLAGRTMSATPGCRTSVTFATVLGPSHVAAPSAGAEDVQWKITSPAAGVSCLQVVARTRTPWSAIDGGWKIAGSYFSSN